MISVCELWKTLIKTISTLENKSERVNSLDRLSAEFLVFEMYYYSITEVVPAEVHDVQYEIQWYLTYDWLFD